MRRRPRTFPRPAAVPRLVLVALLTAALPAPADEPRPGGGKDELPSVQKERLAAMKRMASRYEIAAGEGGETRLRLTEEPVLRWSNPERNNGDGGLYLFTDKGRPRVALTIYLTEDRKAWNHEFQSLAERELVAKKEDLENKIDALKYQKDLMAPDDYKRQISAMLLELARTQEAIDK